MTVQIGAVAWPEGKWRFVLSPVSGINVTTEGYRREVGLHADGGLTEFCRKAVMGSLNTPTFPLPLELEVSRENPCPCGLCLLPSHSYLLNLCSLTLEFITVQTAAPQLWNLPALSGCTCSLVVGKANQALHNFLPLASRTAGSREPSICHLCSICTSSEY